MQRIIEYFKTMGVDANTTITLLITLFTFSSGLFLAWVAKLIASTKQKNSYKKSLILILQDFGKACDKQHKIVSKSLEQTGFKKGKGFIISYVPIGTLDYLNKLDFNLFLQNFEPTFFNKLFSKAISKLFELVAQIKIQNASIKSILKEFSDRYSEHERQYYENISQLRKLHDKLGVHLDGKKLDKENGGVLIQSFFEIFGNWFKNGADRNIAITHKEIVLKCLELNKEQLNFPIILEINEFALKCDIAYENIEKIDDFLKDKFKQFADFHRRASKLINVIIKIIK